MRYSRERLVYKAEDLASLSHQRQDGENSSTIKSRRGDFLCNFFGSSFASDISYFWKNLSVLTLMETGSGHSWLRGFLLDILLTLILDCLKA